MRLIDADALQQEWMYIDSIPAVTERDIDNAPTIDAIPVEWLREFDLYYAGISGGTPYMNELVKAWQRTGGIA